MPHTDVAIIGAGIVGLAHALAAARRGLRVVVFERSLKAVGASIRNFGMIWPIGQPTGSCLDRALLSRRIWIEVAEKAGLYLDPCGSLLLVYRSDEQAVVEEFLASTGDAGYSASWLTPAKVAEKSPAAVTEGLLGALWSSSEMTVDPRQVIHRLPTFLSEIYSVAFCFGQAVTQVTYPYLIAGGEKWSADRILVCSGVDFETLYPDLYRRSGITRVKLQMMRTGAQTWRLGPSLCAGLTLTHYGSFAHCPSLSLLKTRIEQETPHFPQWGIHVMMSQNGLGELIIGDSHEYGLDLDPFDRTEINTHILNQLKTFARIPSWEMSQTWQGLYPKIPGKPHLIDSPESGVTVINALSGAGMTLSFGLAEENFSTWS
jgi:FAD dependent oxidoreductase TIGR03364